MHGGRTPNAVVAKRVEDIYGLVVDGQPLRVIRQFVADSCNNWGEPEPIPDRTLRNYMRRATALIKLHAEEACEDIREKHIARLERLYASCVGKGDRRTALAVEQEIARLHGLNAPTKTELTGAGGAPLIPTEELADRFDDIVREQARRLGKGGPSEG